MKTTDEKISLVGCSHECGAKVTEKQTTGRLVCTHKISYR